jgi:hypothetical protein
MLRQAMDAAEGRLQEQQQQGHPPDEASRLLYSQLQPSVPPSETTGYGTASQSARDEYDDEDDDDEEEGSLQEDSYADDDWSDSQLHQQRHPGIARRAWDSIRNLFMLVANVENLWDSPAPTTGDVDAGNGGGGGGYPIHHRNAGSTVASMQSSTNAASLRRRSYLIVLFWFVVLAGGYATERSTFKLLVDRAGPFRLFSVEMVTIAHAMMLGTWMVVSNLYHNRQVSTDDNNESSRIPLGIPLVDVGCK